MKGWLYLGPLLRGALHGVLQIDASLPALKLLGREGELLDQRRNTAATRAPFTAFLAHLSRRHADELRLNVGVDLQSVVARRHECADSAAAHGGANFGQPVAVADLLLLLVEDDLLLDALVHSAELVV